ncbi:MAG: FecR family protein [Candidatus Cryptobacteroides sp.]
MNENEQLLAQAEALLQDIRYMESIDCNKAYERGMKKIRARRRSRVASSFVRIAACLSVPFMAAAGIFGYLYFSQQKNDTYTCVSALSGSVVRYELPDHSTVWLNSGSSLSYPTRFAKNRREVKLEGEAYFDVKASRKQPFYVHTSDSLSVRVYGTRFNVAAYGNENLIETTLESGHVDVEVENVGTLCLVPGEQALYDKTSGSLHKRSVNTSDNCSWKDGRLVFRNSSLDNIFRQLSRKFGVDFRVEGTLSDDTFRATFRNESLSRIMDYLAETAGFSWHSADRTIIVELNNQ